MIFVMEIYTYSCQRSTITFKIGESNLKMFINKLSLFTLKNSQERKSSKIETPLFICINFAHFLCNLKKTGLPFKLGTISTFQSLTNLSLLSSILYLNLQSLSNIFHCATCICTVPYLKLCVTQFGVSRGQNYKTLVRNI